MLGSCFGFAQGVIHLVNHVNLRHSVVRSRPGSGHDFRINKIEQQLIRLGLSPAKHSGINCIKIRTALNNWTTLSLGAHRGIFKRAMSYLLVFMIAYGSAVGASHSHGCVHPNVSKTPAFSDSGGSQSQNSRHSNHTECSMCHLQQQLFKGFASTPCLAPASSSQLTSACAPQVIYSSISTKARRGRAPPASLSLYNTDRHSPLNSHS